MGWLLVEFLLLNENNLSAVSGSTTRELAIAIHRLLESRFSTRRWAIDVCNKTGRGD